MVNQLTADVEGRHAKEGCKDACAISCKYSQPDVPDVAGTKASTKPSEYDCDHSKFSM